MTVDLVPAAVAVLETNWAGSHTLPATGLYPHQWSWDSSFIAIGLRHVSPRRAGQELDSLLSAQWSDGRLPQIVFDPHRDREYAPGASFWRSSHIPASPPRVDTAGFVQPPNHAWAVWEVHQADAHESARRGLLERAYPRLVAWHGYLTQRRKTAGLDLPFIVHPWESGTDNSPLWDEGLQRVPGTPEARIDRVDLEHAATTERPSDREYGRYFWLTERYRDHDCDDADTVYPFRFVDPMFAALLAVSERSLAAIAAEIGQDPEPHRREAQRIGTALESLWDPELGCYTAWDIIAEATVRKRTANGLVPLLLPGPHEDELLATLRSAAFLGSGALLPPSYDTTAADFDAQRYWRGPAWFNISWMLIRALQRVGRSDDSEILQSRLTRLAVEHDFPEYVQPWTGAPHGTRRFSWTAALALDTALAPPTASVP